MTSLNRDHVVLLHISDIHFRADESGTPLDPHKLARHELLKDASSLATDHGPVDTVVVSGDITSAGRPEEFELARVWLGQLCDAIGRDLSAVVTVPGNHDVDCRTIHDNPMIEIAQDALRTADDTNREEFSRKYLSHRESVETLLRTHSAYNEFAARFECHIVGPDRLHWERDLRLNDGSTLRLRGMTSTLCSDHARDAYGNLFINETQYQFFSEPHVVYGVICHHPPAWTSVRDEMEDGLTATRLQLFGHKHRLRPERVRDALRIGAGALQPGGSSVEHLRAYSMVKLSVDAPNNCRELVVDVLPRRWKSQPPPGFEAERNGKGNEVWQYRLPLPMWTAPSTIPEDQPMANNSRELNDQEFEAERDPAADARALFIRFFELPYSRRWQVCGSLDLLRDEDRELPDYQKFVLALRRAIDGGQSDELARAIAEAKTRSS